MDFGIAVLYLLAETARHIPASTCLGDIYRPNWDGSSDGRCVFSLR
jgi:hypothetical protein